ncbi:MAG: hypothetical protein GX949_05425 [Peptococcaceae bacterium]|jgi:uncharacterized HAD superfamily protein|nr:hypothetical protein [Peptococcaceae bacterium]
MRVGVDIDGVLADSLSLWLKELNSYFNKSIEMPQTSLQDICVAYGIREEDLLAFMRERGSFFVTEPKPLPGAAHYLNEIKKNHDIFIVSARDEAFGKETREWLSKHNLPYDEILLLGDHDKTGACLDNGLNVMIDDMLRISVEVSSAGVPVLLMDAPYNQGDLPDLVYRARSWREIYKIISQGTKCFNKKT